MDEWSSSRFFSMANKHYQENQKKILDLLEEKSNGRLLDIGCNDGKFTIELAKKSKCSPYGIEINETVALSAREKKVKVKLTNANDELPFSKIILI